MAADALLTAMDFYFEDHRIVPEPSAPRRGEVLISLPASVFARLSYPHPRQSPQSHTA